MAAVQAATASLNTTEDSKLRPTKLFIGGLTKNTTTKQLRDHFSQYGRVLDCVAMRQPDGRSRGFGYVTLDSPMAADRCLSEPQNIDDRIVDMKRAVPGPATNCGNEYSWSGGRSPSNRSAAAHGGPPGSWDMSGYYGYGAAAHYAQSLWAHSWAGAPSPKSNDEVLDCLDLLVQNKGPASPNSRLLGTLPSAFMSEGGSTASYTPAATPSSRLASLSATAPEFFPSSSNDADDAAQAEPEKTGRTVLADVTNIIPESGATNGSKASMMDPVKAPLPTSMMYSTSPAKVSGLTLTAAAKVQKRPMPSSLMVYDDAEDTEVAGVMTVESEKSSEAENKNSTKQEDDADTSRQESAFLTLPAPLRLPESAVASRSAFPCGLPPGLAPPAPPAPCGASPSAAAAATPTSATSVATAAASRLPRCEPGVLSTMPMQQSPMGDAAARARALLATPGTWTTSPKAGAVATLATAGNGGACKDEADEVGDSACVFAREELLRHRQTGKSHDADLKGMRGLFAAKA